MRALLAELPSSACLVDDEGRLTAINEPLTTLLGVDRAVLVGEHLSSVVGDDTAADLLRASHDDGPSAVRRACRLGPAGERYEVVCRPIADAGRHAALCVVGDDGPVESRRPDAVDEALAALPVATLTLRADGSVASWNRAAERTLGWTEGDAIGDRPPFLLEHAGHRWQVLRERVARGEWVAGVELPVRTAGGTVMTATVRAAPLAGDRMLAVVQSRSSPADQTQQLRLLDRVLRHNVRNDVNVVMGHAERLAGTIDDPGLAASVAAIQERSRSIIDLSEKARAFTDVIDAEHELRTVDLTAVASDVVARFRGRHPGVEFALAAPRTASADAVGPVQTAVANLVENAVEHNDAADPRVEVSVSTVRHEGHDYVELAVADNGPGVPREEREVFIEGREDPLEHGSGLGLWLVYWVVRKSGGELLFDENEPRGSVLTVRLARATGFDG